MSLHFYSLVFFLYDVNPASFFSRFLALSSFLSLSLNWTTLVQRTSCLARSANYCFCRPSRFPHERTSPFTMFGDVQNIIETLFGECAFSSRVPSQWWRKRLSYCRRSNIAINMRFHIMYRNNIKYHIKLNYKIYIYMTMLIYVYIYIYVWCINHI